MMLMSFFMSYVNAAAPPPTNDDPCNAILLTVNSSCTFVSGTNIGATATIGVSNPSCNGNYNGGDVWFKAVVPSNGILQVTTQATATITDGAMAFYSGTCNSLTEIFCDRNSAPGTGSMPEISATGLTPNDTIWIRFWESNNNDLGNFDICATSLVSPQNDDPCNAILLSIDSTCNAVTGSNVNATASNVPDPGCATYLGGDVWYKAVVPPNGYLNFNTLPGTVTNGGMALYHGRCDSLVLIACDDDDGIGGMPEMAFLSLTPGDTIWIRFWDKSNNNFGTFDICVTSQSITTPPSCSINAPAGNTCATATPICNLDGYCGNTSASYTADYWTELNTTFNTCLGGASIQNNSFLKFVASANTATFNVWVTSSTDGVGIQMFFFEASNCSGNVVCHGGYDNLFPGPSHLITASNLTIGNTYYLMIDGVGGDVCDYVIGALSGLSALVVLPSSSSICLGESVNLSANGVSGTGTTYTWSWNDAQNVPHTYTNAVLTDTPSITTTYTVTSSGVGICEQTKNITIEVKPVPDVIITGNNAPVCFGSDVKFYLSGTPGAVVSYTINGSLNNTLTINNNGLDTIVVNNSSVTQQLLIQSVSKSNCSKNLNLSSTVISDTVNAHIIGNNGPICAGENAVFTLSGTPGAVLTYHINSAADTTLVLTGSDQNIILSTVNTDQTLHLVSVAAGVCTTILSDQSTVNVNPLITPTFTQWGPYCKDDILIQVMLPTTSLEGIEGVWNPGMVSTNAAGSFQYIFTPNVGQCAAPASMTVVVNPLPQGVDAGPSFTINSGNSIQLQGSGTGGDITWSPAIGLSNSSILTPIASPTETTSYILLIETDFGCKATDSTTVFVNDYCPEPMKVFTPNHDGMYEKWITHSTSCIKLVKASVYNRYGSLVFHSDDYQNNWDGTYNGKPLPDATYYFVLQMQNINNKKYTRKGSVTIIR